jgi:hypothetical protein
MNKYLGFTNLINQQPLVVYNPLVFGCISHMKYEKSFTNPCYQDLMFGLVIRFAHALRVFRGRGVVGAQSSHVGNVPPPTLPSKDLRGGPSKYDLFGGKEKVSTFHHKLMPQYHWSSAHVK